MDHPVTPHEHHIMPVKAYVAVVSCLFVFTAITVFAAFVDLGWVNTPLALTIALFKGTIVVLFFMHVRYNTPLMWVVAGSGFFFLLILLSLTLQDYVSRSWETPSPLEFLSL